MRTFTLVLALLLLGGSRALAFECDGVKLPSSLVICSDPELMGLADERQEALNEARGRIGEGRFPQLWEDQKAWVQSYATACGVPPDRPAPIPVPASIKACFKRAAIARIAYLRGYGVTATLQPQGAIGRDRVGPSFDCSKAGYPLALMLCADPDLSRLDLRFNQAYWALFQQLGPAEQPQLKEEDLTFFDQVQEQCGVPRSGPLTAEAWRSRDCVRGAYEKMREVWLARLTGPAHEEAVRPPEEHVALQQALQELGFVPPGPIDGVYGRATRSAILAWQSARGRVVIGFLGDADALALEREISRGSGTIRGPQRRAMEPAGEVPDRVPLVETNGIYTVPVLINGVLPLQFVLDSGAADVSLPADVFLTLIRTGTIVKEDYIGKGGYRLADGSTVQSDRFFIRELKVGNKVLKNISASVGGVDSSLLLGQSFLKRFASVQIDNNRNVLVLGDERIDVPTFSNSLPSPPAASIYSPESRPNTATALPTTNQGSRGRIGVKIQDHVTGQHEEPSDTPRERQSLKSRWADLLTALALSRAISFSQLMGRGCTAGPIC